MTKKIKFAVYLYGLALVLSIAHYSKIYLDTNTKAIPYYTKLKTNTNHAPILSDNNDYTFTALSYPFGVYSKIEAKKTKHCSTDGRACRRRRNRFHRFFN